MTDGEEQKDYQNQENETDQKQRITTKNRFNSTHTPHILHLGIQFFSPDYNPFFSKNFLGFSFLLLIPSVRLWHSVTGLHTLGLAFLSFYYCHSRPPVVAKIHLKVLDPQVLAH